MDAFGVVILQIIAMVAVGYTMASITIAVLSTLNEANAESLVRDVAILISYMVGLDKSLCFGERNLFPVCNKVPEISTNLLAIGTLMYHI